ncbi:DUF1622 domain-containing protein [Yinghuangia sp. ASG 101]|uniref:DUF1622 domain-containing protein n=1 Tax=Yinghuangia sp. ASG 101 TaxID=2896848 RepID=UPI001E309C89|nr:DUF1622 domain-containing protein [Yinghuangia sp. ASG 101]UGQ12153.1 DUF1622 domain-containing protein [Yinghuangia sp. ASG 101]
MYADVLPESTLRDVVDLAVRLVEFAGALIILVGAAWAFALFVGYGAVRVRRWRESPGAASGFNRIRLTLGRFLALGLEFQLAGDILRTAIAPSFTEIGQLAAIAAIRTVLNYVLGREIEQERRELERSASRHGATASGNAP